MGLMSVGGNIVKIGSNTISVGAPDPEIYVTPSEITNVSYLGATCPATVCGNKNNSVTVADACTWVVTTTPVIPSVSGTINNIQVCENLTSSCRSAVVCYTPDLGGAMKCVTICQSTGDTKIYVTPTPQTGLDGGGANVYEYVCGPTSNSTAFATACSWIHATTPVSPCASPGRAHLVCIDANTTYSNRSGTACYTPTVGTMRTITFCQNASPYYAQLCTCTNSPANGTSYYACTTGQVTYPASPPSGAYGLTVYWQYTLPNISPYTAYVCWRITCNGTCIAGLTASCTTGWGDGNTCTLPNCIDYNDNVCVYMCVQTDSFGCDAQACVNVQLWSVASCQASPCYCQSNTIYCNEAYTCGLPY